MLLVVWTLVGGIAAVDLIVVTLVCILFFLRTGVLHIFLSFALESVWPRQKVVSSSSKGVTVNRNEKCRRPDR